MQPANLARLVRALAREGLDVRRDGPVWTVRLLSDPHAPPAEVLLPDGFPVEGKALRQLADLAAVHHPGGGRVVRAYASPDFHPGDSGIAIGSVVETDGMVVPAAVGSDINCGMRLHVADLGAERFLSRRDAFVHRLEGDYFFATRDVSLTAKAMRGLFRHGLPGLLSEVAVGPTGCLARSELDQLFREVDRVHLGGSLDGDVSWAPEDLVPEEGVVRDGGLATIGGGNHFVEVQVVEQVIDRARAWAWGVREGQVAFMVHSGSRHVGKYVGGWWRDKARDVWPAGLRHPKSHIFPLSLAHQPDLVREYLVAEATAANYGFVNRMLLAELLRLHLRALFGEVEAPLVYDLPHNITLPEGAGWVARKGACPAHEGHPVIIPGSMGASSYLLAGLGNPRTLCSASHGAGRARSRFAMGRGDWDDAAMGLLGVDCITLREERRIEEAPAAYKPIGPVIECQQRAGVADVVARMRPLLTFKA